jgi:Fe-S cluster assembly scaffold protein SufB
MTIRIKISAQAKQQMQRQRKGIKIVKKQRALSPLPPLPASSTACTNCASCTLVTKTCTALATMLPLADACHIQQAKSATATAGTTARKIKIKVRANTKPAQPSKPSKPVTPAKSKYQIKAKDAKLVAVESMIAAASARHCYTTVANPRNPSELFKLDPDQIDVVTKALSGQSFCILGAAGAGKTTALQAVVLALLDKYKHAWPYSFKIKGEQARLNASPIFIGAPTNKAVAILRDKLLRNPELASKLGAAPNITTLHNLLEFKPEYVWSNKKNAEVFTYLPQRTRYHPLYGLKVIIIDESSMVGVSVENQSAIWNRLYDAMEKDTQVILVGDINQIPPVGGKSVLSYGLNQLPRVELTYFHRQAAESPVLNGAHQLLHGQVPEERHNEEIDSKVKYIEPTQAQKPSLADTNLYKMWLSNKIKTWLKQGGYKPESDIWILPINKNDNLKKQKKKDIEQEINEKEVLKAKRQGRYLEYVSTDWVNKTIATIIAREQYKVVQTIQAGFKTFQLAVGDKVLVHLREATVTGIKPNHRFAGVVKEYPSQTIDYFGNHTRMLHLQENSASKDTEEYILDAMGAAQERTVDNAVKEAEDEKPVSERQASHVVCIKYWDDPEAPEEKLSFAGEFADQVFQLGYALSAHKAQGSEWRRVFIPLHKLHHGFLYKEWLYTAMTRASNDTILIGDKALFKKASKNTRIKGITLEDKIEYFNDGDYLTEITLSKLAKGDEA